MLRIRDGGTTGVIGVVLNASVVAKLSSLRSVARYRTGDCSNFFLRIPYSAIDVCAISNPAACTVIAGTLFRPFSFLLGMSLVMV
jgi:hypothetical protein